MSGEAEFSWHLRKFGESPLEARGDFRVQGEAWTAPILEGTLRQTSGLCTTEAGHTCPPSQLGAGAGGSRAYLSSLMARGRSWREQGNPFQLAGKGVPNRLLSPRKPTWVLICLPKMLQAPHKLYTQTASWAKRSMQKGPMKLWQPKSTS